MMPDAPRKPGRPRKVVEPESTPEVAPDPKPAPVNTPPGPIQLEIRVGRVGEQTKIACTQRVHSYMIDQQSDTLTVTGVLRVTE